MEKKVYHLGTWHDDIITDTVIRNMAIQVKEGKGSKVKLTVSKTGLSVVKSSRITGTSMTDYLPIEKIYFITVNKYHPSCLMVIGKDHPTKYQVLAFRCVNGLDAGMFVNLFKEIKSHTNPGEGYNFETKKQHDGANWTLRSKNQNNNNRQLSAVVDMHSERSKAVNGDIRIAQMNGGSHNEHGEVRAYITTEPSNMTTQVATHTITTGTAVRQDTTEERHIVHHRLLSDNVSEASETSLREELDSLSQELRDIKFMLEKSTGINPDEYPQSAKLSPRRIEEVIVTRQVEHPRTETVVTREETVTEVVRNSQSNGHAVHHIQMNGRVERAASPQMEGEVRITVPDYRSSNGSTGKVYTSTETPRDYVDGQGDLANYKSWGGDRRSQVQPQQNWRNEVVLRQRVVGRARPRSAVYSTSSYGNMSGSLRSARAPSMYVVADHNGHHGNHHTAPSNRGGSYKRMNVSTTVQKPIERVYGRRSAYGGRPVIVERASIVDYNQNNVEKSHEHNPRGSVIIRT